jgi:acyl-coenzyme A synthetase/AMP-(fatty) acid ligase
MIKQYYGLLQDRSTLINVYGVTEATVDSSYCLTNGDGASFCNIGQPLPHTVIHLLDKHGQPVPPGFPGEITIGGEGVARGYLYEEEQTMRRFFADPGGAGRFYRTGDIGRWRPDGQIEFIGRDDRQVKVNGFRVEPAEVEQAILQHPDVQQALVTTLHNQHSETQLIAYFTGNPAPDTATLRSFLEAKLPAYLLPGWIVPLQEMPRNEHGKIDKTALPDPRSGRTPHDAGEDRRAKDETERTLVALWEEVLECTDIGIQDNFFELGGNSLKLIRLYNSIQEIYPDKLEIHQLFSHPTIAEISGLLRPVLAGSNESFKEINLIEL